MTKQSKDEKPTDSNQEELERSQARKRLQEQSKEIPHPGTVRVTIFPNPRGRRFEVEEETSNKIKK